ncbi:MAG: DUF3489 domain-containing protein [Acidobacteria bacterium]|nr:DUF3489 domain-containing protein [Acidobacteriota bacterium]
MPETTTTTTEASVAEKGAKGATKTRPANKKAPKAAKAAKRQPPAKAAKTEMPKLKGKREGIKSAVVLEMLRRSKGATLAELMAATLWQAHSVRGFLSGTVGKKMGLKVESTRREDGERLYKLTN